MLKDFLLKKRIVSNPREPYAFIVDGHTLTHIFELNLQDDFRKVAMRCESVLCCRMSPGQKAQVIFYFSFFPP